MKLLPYGSVLLLLFTSLTWSQSTLHKASLKKPGAYRALASVEEAEEGDDDEEDQNNRDSKEDEDEDEDEAGTSQERQQHNSARAREQSAPRLSEMARPSPRFDRGAAHLSNDFPQSVHMASGALPEVKSGNLSGRPQPALRQASVAAHPLPAANIATRPVVWSQVSDFLDKFSPTLVGSAEEKRITSSDAFLRIRKHRNLADDQRMTGRVNCARCHN